MRYVKGLDRDQVMMCSLDSFVDKESDARLIDAFVDSLDLENLEIISTVRAMVMDKDQVMAFLSSMKGGKPTKQPTTTHQEVTENE